jgi:alcohol dehydrogenase class IV
MQFEFATASRLIFGPGSVKDLASAARSMGSRALIVTGRSTERAAKHTASLDAAWFSISGEPKIDDVRRGAALAHAESCDTVIGFGGGSAIDAGKAIAALLGNGGDPLDYLEVVGKVQPLSKPSAPFIAVPTTAGTGSEMTRNAVLSSPEYSMKASLRSAGMLPRLAIVDPDLTIGLPPSITASTGLDALTQLIEPYVSHRANPMTDAICLQGIPLVAHSLVEAYYNDDAQCREAMSLASMWSGIALANAALGAVHGFAAAIGGMFPAPHGAVCAALLPAATECSVAALRERAPGSPALQRYQTVAALLTDTPHARIEDGIAWLKNTADTLAIPPLRTYGITSAHFTEIVEKARNASSMKGNPIVLTTAELTSILERAC